MSFGRFSLGCEPIPHLRRYFIKHLVDVVERNANRKHEAEVRGAGPRLANFDNQSAKSTGVVQKTKPPPSSHMIRRVDEAPQPILSTDWNSGKSSFNTGST